jgi:hypothetical protein
MIRGYPARASVVPGATLTLHVGTDAPRFRIAFHRWADGFVPMHRTGWLDGFDVPAGTAHEDWRWPAYTFDIPRDWPSGVYVAHLQAPDAAPLQVSQDCAAALFVVRGAGRSPLLYKIPLATYHAYNCTGGACFYFAPPRSSDPPGSRLTLQRPGGGIGGITFGAEDFYDSTSPRQTFAHWDARFIRWLLAQGYAPEFCTDFDVHEDPGLLERHRLLISVGHDEYWSEPMRDAVERHVARGRNVAFFGANLCWWRIHVVEGGTAIVCHQGSRQGAFDHWWPPTGVHRPEDAMTGVSYRHGGGWWDGPRRTRGFIVQQPEHWVFAGTGLGRGDAIGVDTTPPLVGYECDGAPLEWIDEAHGLARIAPDAQQCGTPEQLELLAVGPLDGDWQELPHRETHATGEGVHAATMTSFARGGTVFTAGTTDWAQVLASGQDARVARITRNVLERLLR